MHQLLFHSSLSLVKNSFRWYLVPCKHSIWFNCTWFVPPSGRIQRLIDKCPTFPTSTKRFPTYADFRCRQILRLQTSSWSVPVLPDRYLHIGDMHTFPFQGWLSPAPHIQSSWLWKLAASLFIKRYPPFFVSPCRFITDKRKFRDVNLLAAM